jgi:hypothetical protein
MLVSVITVGVKARLRFFQVRCDDELDSVLRLA